MRILMTQRELRERGGSEMVTVELAVELSKRGHEVAVFCARASRLQTLVLAAGVWVKHRLSEIPWKPDVIHGHHHLQMVTALSYFEATPAIYYCHGLTPWVEKPPLHPRIHRYVMMCPWLAPRMEPEHGIPGSRVTSVGNFVNTARFSRFRDPAPLPRRALVFGNGAFSLDELARLEAACAENGLTLEKIGYAFGNPQPRPEVFLLDYDIVFAIGKCALEAMASGCAVITVLPGQAGGLVTPDNLSHWLHSNFSPRYYSSAAQITADWLRQEMCGYSPARVAEVTATVRAVHSLERCADRFERIYQEVVQEHASQPVVAQPRELAPYLESIHAEVDSLWAESSELASLRKNVEYLHGLHGQLHTLQTRLLEAKTELRAQKSRLRSQEALIAKQQLRWNLAVAFLREKVIGRWFLSRMDRMYKRVKEAKNKSQAITNGTFLDSEKWNSGGPNKTEAAMEPLSMTTEAHTK